MPTRTEAFGVFLSKAAPLETFIRLEQKCRLCHIDLGLLLRNLFILSDSTKQAFDAGKAGVLKLKPLG